MVKYRLFKKHNISKLKDWYDMIINDYQVADMSFNTFCRICYRRNMDYRQIHKYFSMIISVKEFFDWNHIHFLKLLDSIKTGKEVVDTPAPTIELCQQDIQNLTDIEFDDADTLRDNIAKAFKIPKSWLYDKEKNTEKVEE